MTEQEELFEEPVEVVEEPVEIVEEVQEEPKEKNQNGRKTSKKTKRAKVVVLRAYAFKEADMNRGYIATLTRGNQVEIQWVEDNGMAFVKLLNSKKETFGYVQLSKLKEI